MPTDKDALLAHLLDHHPKMVEPSPRRPRDVTGSLVRLGTEQLRKVHAHDHYRYPSTLDHVHWDGTDADRDLGPDNRPAGWTTGLDVRLRRPPLATEAISFDRTVDEHGQDQWGWFCGVCEEGDFGPDPNQREREAADHARQHATPDPYELGWSNRSAPHVIVTYDGGRPHTACGKTLTGLMGNQWVEPGQPTPGTLTCEGCLSHIRSATKEATR